MGKGRTFRITQPGADVAERSEPPGLFPLAFIRWFAVLRFGNSEVAADLSGEKLVDLSDLAFDLVAAGEGVRSVSWRDSIFPGEEWCEVHQH